jgi:hypothetical protein
VEVGLGGDALVGGDIALQPAAVARQPCCPTPTTKMAGAGDCGSRFR